MYKRLRERIAGKTARISVIGLGYVGLPLAVEFARSGFFVYGIDVDKGRIKALKAGRSYIADVPSRDIRQAERSGCLVPIADYGKIKRSDVVIICVPTPLSKTREPDISYILTVVKTIAGYRKRDQLIVLESTTYPGTTDEILLPLLQSKGLRCGKDFFLAFSPERVDPANRLYKTRDIPKVVGGSEMRSGTLAKELYGKIIKDVFLASSTKTAEMTKLLENTFRSVNIALVNEIALMCDKLGLDVWEAIEAASSKPFGFMPFYPGPGIGGHCIPLDPMYLAWKAKLHGFEIRFIGLADRINSSMPAYIVSRIESALNERKKALNGSKVHILGLSYKKDVSDTRESPALEIIRLLLEKGAKVTFSDPYSKRCIIGKSVLRAQGPDKKTLKGKDCVAIITDHSAYDYRKIAGWSRLLFDTRNATKGVPRRGGNIVRL
jgi:UDP-N-acetyl-D-glucosamine dehydrogenase